jgi:hypothetical protein
MEEVDEMAEAECRATLRQERAKTRGLHVRRAGLRAVVD